MAKFLHFNHVMSCNSSISKQQGNIGTRLWLPDVDSRMIRLKRILAFSSIICLFYLFSWIRNLIWTLKIAPNWNSWKEFWHFCVFIWLFVLFLSLFWWRRNWIRKLRQIAAAWAAQTASAHGWLTGRPFAGSRQFCLASAVPSLSLIKLMLRNFIFLFACRFSTNFVFSFFSLLLTQQQKQ